MELRLAFDAQRYQGLAGFRMALRQFLAASEVISRTEGVTAQQYQALLAIGCGPAPMTMKDLAESLLLQPHAAVQMVNRLAKAGVLLTLTAAGETLLESLAEQHLREMIKQEPHLSKSLRRIRQAAD